MAKIGGTKGWVVAAGIALLMAFVAVPALSGAASAAPVTSAAATSPSTTWAYGGSGSWSGTTTLGTGATITWNSTYGLTVVFTLTPVAGAVGTWTLEEVRTVGMTVTATYSGPVVQAKYTYQGSEQDVGFANITNQSMVYVSGQAVPALGIENASASVVASLSEAISKTVAGHTASASLAVQGHGNAATSFSPSLGLIPLNLTGVNAWNSTATGSPSASWVVNYQWNDQGYNGTTASGNGSKSGSLSGTGTVTLNGFKVHPVFAPIFPDGKPRTAVVIVVQGVFDNYMGFIWIPHAFDLFGSASHAYDSVALGSGAISADTLYVGSGATGPTVTGAESTFGANDASVNTLAAPQNGPAPAASSGGPGGTVPAGPMPVSQANAEASCLLNGCGSATAAAPLGGLLVATIGVAVVVVVGTVGVIEWRSYARRKSQKGLVGGYGESWPNGVPPAASLSPPGMNPPQEKDLSGESNLRP